MDVFTTLDVVNYAMVKDKHTVMSVIGAFFELLARRTHHTNMTINPQILFMNMSRWFAGQPSMKAIMPMPMPTPIVLPEQIDEYEWTAGNTQWLLRALEDCIVETKTSWRSMRSSPFQLGHPRELFHAVCAVLLVKFPRDDHLKCIIDDMVTAA